MAMNSRDAEVERLAAESAELSGQSKTAAAREALPQTRGDDRVLLVGLPDRDAHVG